MNGVRSIFRRKGYLLTALAAAVLLAASSGTAWAQTPSVDFEDPSVTVREGADGRASNANSNPAVKVNVIVSGLPSGPIGTSTADVDTPRREAIKALGALSFSVGQPAAGSMITLTVELDAGADGGGEAGDATLSAGDDGELELALELDDKITLTLSAPEGGEPEGVDVNWQDESFSVGVTSDSGRVVNIGRPLQGTIKDKDWTPVASFDDEWHYHAGRR